MCTYTLILSIFVNYVYSHYMLKRSELTQRRKYNLFLFCFKTKQLLASFYLVETKSHYLVLLGFYVFAFANDYHVINRCCRKKNDAYFRVVCTTQQPHHIHINHKPRGLQPLKVQIFLFCFRRKITCLNLTCQHINAVLANGNRMYYR